MFSKTSPLIKELSDAADRQMIATVTLNPTVDKTMTVPHFAVGKTNRGHVEQIDAGGKGINVAKALKQLGCPVTAMGFLAGSNGRFISESLAAWQIASDFIFVPGETRINLKIRDPIADTETEINEPGFEVASDDLIQLERTLEDRARRSAVVVLSGSLPPGVPGDVYASLINIARDCGARTILDSSGEALKFGVRARPDLIKPNQAEAGELLQTEIEGGQHLIWAARQLMAMGASTVVISLGADGALAATADRMLRSRPPHIEVRSSVGAGDSMVAGLACAMAKKLPLREALRLATAAAAATASVKGSNVADRRLIDEMLPRVVVEEVD